MSGEFREVSPDDENIETMEEDYIIEEIVDIKEENDSESERIIYSDDDENSHIVCLGKEESSGEDVYHCTLCNMSFSSVEHHTKTMHGGTSIQQYEEIQVLTEEVEDGEADYYSEKVEEEEEEEPETETKDIVCNTCDYVFETMNDVEYHECKGIELSRVLICNNNCRSVFVSQEDLDAHQCQALEMKEDSTPSMFSCPECPKKFSLINALQQHQKSHKAKRNQIKKTKKGDNADTNTHCDICNTTFSSSKNLKLHAKMHLPIQKKSIKDAMPIGSDELGDKDQFYCEICNKSFDHALLTVHQNLHQNFEEHNCSICNRQFENQVSYDMHMQLHTDQPARVRPQQVAKPGARFACNYCGREFLRPHEKVKHERIHTGEKPHECEVCGKSFRVSYSLTLHLRTHTDVRPFVCAQCNKRFKAYSVYSHHLNTHSEDRPYKCPMCMKSFRTSVQLCGHKNSHTKPYNCPDCNRPFASLYAVKMHMKTHNKANKSNENLKHRCGVCGAVYARTFALRFHMKEQHSAELPEGAEKRFKDKQPPITADDCFNEDEVSTQAILQGEEIIIDNFHTEEIVTDWLTQK